MAQTLTGATLSRHLASSSKPTRDKSLRLLKTWLPSQTHLSPTDLKNIWKGLFYSLWHADKSQPQLQLITHLSSFLLTLNPSLSLDYFQTFLLTIRREWSGIDSLRLDKFYLLIRKFMSTFFILMKKHDWDLGFVGQLMEVLEEKTLLTKDRFPAQGVNYHVCEVFWPELKPLLPVNLQVIEIMLKPFFDVLTASADKIFLHKVKSNVFDTLLANGRKLIEAKKNGDESSLGGSDKVEVFGAIALKLGLAKKLFELGSSAECVQGNRKVLFGLSEEFEKLERDFVSSGVSVEIVIPEGTEGFEEDEVPELIPISNGLVENGNGSKKKSKKVKKSEALVEKMEVDGNGSVNSEVKKSKKVKKESGGKKKSSKTKKSKNEVSDTVGEKENDSNGENVMKDGDLITFNESVISNLQMQFEKVAAEVGMDTDGVSSFDLPATPVNGTLSKKRKRAKSTAKKVAVLASPVFGDSAIGKNVDKSAKKVRFSMKSNLEWKPHNPLPPQDLRLPPSATPRGSALKKGCPPGPVVDTPVSSKKKQRANSVKKMRKGLKSVSPSVKRLKKLRPPASV